MAGFVIGRAIQIFEFRFPDFGFTIAEIMLAGTLLPSESQPAAHYPARARADESQSTFFAARRAVDLIQQVANVNQRLPSHRQPEVGKLLSDIDIDVRIVNAHPPGEGVDRINDRLG